ncbi:MAG: lysophospholipid acyltransferase family protein [Saprospiraceae bacterium]|nr:lysophospholipid acyltransferase family protein [Saprospiraceae bacterium]
MLQIALQFFRLVPFGALYVLSDALAFLLYKIIGYRKKVILDNLRRSFPEKSEADTRKIARATYQNLTDVTLETLKSFSAPYAEIERRGLCLNPELVNQYLDRGQSVILTGSHLGNWEYSGLTMPPQFHGATVTAYKPLTNKGMDAYINQARSRTGMELVAMDEVFKAIRKRSGEPTVFILLADQSPSSRKSAHWVEFLGQDTASLPGADVLGRKFGLPVLYYRVVRTTRRGFYEIEFTELCADPSTAAEIDITRAFARRLETDIRQQPEQWLWSHKRWKMRRD